MLHIQNLVLFRHNQFYLQFAHFHPARQMLGIQYFCHASSPSRKARLKMPPLVSPPVSGPENSSVVLLLSKQYQDNGNSADKDPVDYDAHWESEVAS